MRKLCLWGQECNLKLNYSFSSINFLLINFLISEGHYWYIHAIVAVVPRSRPTFSDSRNDSKLEWGSDTTVKFSHPIIPSGLGINPTQLGPHKDRDWKKTDMLISRL